MLKSYENMKMIGFSHISLLTKKEVNFDVKT